MSPITYPRIVPTPDKDHTMTTRRPTITMTITEAGELLGISRSAAYRAATRGDLPTLRIGRRLLVPTGHLLDMLGLDQLPNPEAISADTD